MPVHIVTRLTKSGERRYLVRCQVGGRNGALLHLGSFKRKIEAEECQRWASLELARGVIPDRRALLKSEVEGLKTLREAAVDWLAMRHDLGHLSRKGYTRAISGGPGEIWTVSVRKIAVEDVQDFIGYAVNLGYGHSSISRWLAIIKMTLDHCDIEPNPARSRKIKLPPKPSAIPDPPSSTQVAAILSALSRRFRLPVAVLEATGIRVGELVKLTWGDVDVAESRIRVAYGKTKRARRYVPVPPELMRLIEARLALEDRSVDRRVFDDMTEHRVNNAMVRACVHAGVPRFSPHDLRHRYLSRLIQLGVPVTQVQQLAGHARASVTTDVYGAVLTDTEEAWRLVEF